MHSIVAPTFADLTLNYAEKNSRFLPRISAFVPRISARQCCALTKALYLRYGRFFAEFLSGRSLVPLRLLASPTCVGLRYDVYKLNLEVFLGRLFSQISQVKPDLIATRGIHP